MDWKTDGLVPTFTDGETFAWVIDGRISLEVPFRAPIVAWAEFANPRSSTGRRMLATFQAAGFGPRFEIWRLFEPGTDRYWRASALPREMVTRYIPYATWPHHADCPDASPLLCRLWDAAQEQRRAKTEADRSTREADPLIYVVEALGDAGTDYAVEEETRDEAGKIRAAEYLRECIARIAPENLAEVLFRVTIEYGNASLYAADDE